MQRINLFPNPVFAGPLTNTSHWGDANGMVRDNALHVTGSNGGFGFNVAVPFNVPLVLSMRMDASEDNVAGIMVIQATDKPNINNMLFSRRLKRGISDVLCRFTVPSYGFRFEVSPNGIRDVAVSNVLIERADTYDTAVGGGFRASSRGTRCLKPSPHGGDGVMRVNLYPNPRFSPDGASTGAWGFDYANDMPGDGTLRPSRSQGFDELHVPELALGVEYVFSVRSDNRLGGAMVVIANTYSSTISPDGNGLIVVRLTAPATGILQKENRIVFSNQGVYSQPQLELASTYDAALGGGYPRFFSGDTMPLG